MVSLGLLAGFCAFTLLLVFWRVIEEASDDPES